jgi:hypothetical protein
VDDQLPEERDPIDVGEAQRASDVDFSMAGASQNGSDKIDLTLNPSNQSRTVAAVDVQDRTSGSEQAAHPLDPDLAAMGLGIDHRNAPRSDGQVINVRFAVPRDPAIVKQPDGGPSEVLLQTSTHTNLPLPTLLPDLRAAGLVERPRQEDPEATQNLTRMLLAPPTPLLVLP